MARFDLVTANAAIDRLLEVTDEPRHRFMLQACYRYRYLQIAGRYQEIFGTGGTPWQRTYHMQAGRSGVNLKKPANLKNLHRIWAETDQCIFYVDAEEIAVADHFIASVAHIRQQVSGQVLTGGRALSHLPYVVAERVISLASSQNVTPSENSMYLYKSVVQMILLYGDRCRLIGEDVWEPDPEKAELIEIGPDDAITTREAAAVLAPLIRPLRSYEEVVWGTKPAHPARETALFPTHHAAVLL